MGPDISACFGRSVLNQQRRAISKQLLRALECLHNLRIVHSDMNPGNLHLSLTQPIKSPSVKGKYMSTRVAGNPYVPQRIYED